MMWMEAIGTAIQYIENHITDELTVDMIADPERLSVALDILNIIMK